MQEFKVEPNKEKGIDLTVTNGVSSQVFSLPENICEQIYRAVQFNYYREDVVNYIDQNPNFEEDEFTNDDIDKVTRIYQEKRLEYDYETALSLAFMNFEMQKEKETEEVER